MVDYIAASLLIFGGQRALKTGTVRWLTGGWGFTAAMFWMSFFLFGVCGVLGKSVLFFMRDVCDTVIRSLLIFDCFGFVVFMSEVMRVI